MSKKTNPKLVGAFVIGAIVLVIAGILTFGGRQYFSSKIKFVAFFPGASLSGLDVGSPVTFRGVKVGQITSIVIQYDVARQSLQVPIRFDLDPTRLQFVSGEQNPERNIPELIARGLRGQLQTVSLVTGQTSIDFNFYPDTPARLFGSAAGVGSGVIELPTIPSDIEQLKANITSVLAKVSKLPLEKMSDEIITTIADADLLFRDGDSAVKSGGSLAANINAQVAPLAKSIIGASDKANSFLREAEARVTLRTGEPLQNLNKALVDARKLINDVDSGWPQIAVPAVLALKTAAGAFARADILFKAAQATLSPSSPAYFELVATLREFRFAATAVKVLAEYLQRNPSAILTGNR
jgi:paraquat-inducible protein B